MSVIKELSEKYESYAIDLRRELHAHPELSLQEEWTSARIVEELGKLDIPCEVVGPRNVVGLIDTGRAGRSIAIRADIDALPLTEEVELPFKSQFEGKMHARGHDAHTAMLVTIGRILNETKEQFSGKVYLCFQVAEETGFGADDIVAYLQEKGGVDQVIATHIAGAAPVGTIWIPDGPMYAGNMGFKIVVHGVGGHGSRPDAAVDPIRPACEILQAIAAIPVNRHDPFKTLVVSPCTIHAGTKNNIIPGEAEIEGNIRFFAYGDGDAAVEEIRRMSEHLAAARGCTVEVTSEAMAPYPVINNNEAAARGRALAAQQGLTVLPPADPQAASDNYANFLNAFPGFYTMLGAHSEMPGTSGNHHNPTFCLNEDCIKLGIAFMAGYAFAFLK